MQRKLVWTGVVILVEVLVGKFLSTGWLVTALVLGAFYLLWTWEALPDFVEKHNAPERLTTLDLGSVPVVRDSIHQKQRPVPHVMAQPLPPSRIPPGLKQLLDQVNPPDIVYQTDASPLLMGDLPKQELKIDVALKSNNGGLLLILHSKEPTEQNVLVRLLSIHAIKGGRAVPTSETADVAPHDFQRVRLFCDDPQPVPFIDGDGDALRTGGQSGSKYTLRKRGVYVARLDARNEHGYAYLNVCFEWQDGQAQPKPRTCYPANSVRALVADAFRKAQT